MHTNKEHRIPSPTYMSNEQMCTQESMSPSPYAFVLAHTPPRASKLRECMTITPDADVDLLSSPTASYLQSLRKDRPARPTGSRPPPPSKFGSLRRTEASTPIPVSDAAQPEQQSRHRRTDSALSSSSSTSFKNSLRSPFAGRPLARAPSTSPERPSNANERSLPSRTSSVSYIENGMRWMEKQEAKSIRQAMEDMDLKEESKVYAGAQDEAAELVWKHQNPDTANAPYANPDLGPARDYRSHLRQGSYHRTISQDARFSDKESISSNGFQSSGRLNGTSSSSQRLAQIPPTVSQPTADDVPVPKRRSASGKSYGQLAEAVDADIKVAHRRISSGSSKRIMSAEKKKFMNPDDRIWEDPEEDRSSAKTKVPVIEEQKEATPAASQALPSYVRRNPFARVRAQSDRNLERSNSAPQLQTLPGVTLPRHDRIEIQRNPPSQSRNPLYTSNDLILPPTPPEDTGLEPDEVAPKTTPTKDGREVRGDDIRAATSKSRATYSPNLPRPTMVSDKPGRPIVSFQKDYKKKEIVMEEVQCYESSPKDRPLPDPLQMGVSSGSPHRGLPEPRAKSQPLSPSTSRIPKINLEDVPKWSPSQSTPTAVNGPKPPIPTICAPDDADVPSIVLPEEPMSAPPTIVAPQIPSISFGAPPSSNADSPRSSASLSKSQLPRRQPLPPPSSPDRPLPRHANTAPITPTKSTPHYTPSTHQSSTLCAQCALPIAGRILSAAGSRFHPACFTCHACTTNLELVAFYPEPESHRTTRLSSNNNNNNNDNDNDPSLRFYCHLDYHELFSPRCKSCKTPIEGEIIIACGAEWHVGHFFCAQCGDPFDSSMPFVEKEGFAWCVGCHTLRYSEKCRGCRKPVTDVVVKALGWDWHEACFRCLECNGEFEDGRYFLRGDSQDPVCVKCEQRRLKE